MLDLDIEIDSKAGFCFGVKNAVQKAEDVLKRGDKLYCLGQIVHNQEEVNRLEKMGMLTITQNDLSGIIGQHILIRAHGEPPDTYQLLKENSNIIIEATCPVVLKLQDRIRESHNTGDFVLIYGKKDHPEVIGLLGQLGSQFKVFKDLEELELNELPNRVSLYSQTTMDVDELHSIARKLREKGKEVLLKDTVCRQVSGRKNELQAFASSKDIVLMVAGKNSSNGRVLLDACLEVNPKSLLIANVSDIEVAWFQRADKVGVTGATSTPEWLMIEIMQYLKLL